MELTTDFRMKYNAPLLCLLKVSKHLRKIWTTTFRAMDDIKETVRNAGDTLCRAVSSLTIRLCDVSLTNASDAKETMNIVLPYLLSEGILSKVSSVQKASISLVMKLAKVLSRVIVIMFNCIYLYQSDSASNAIKVQWFESSILA